MSRTLKATVDGKDFIVNPKRFRSGRTGWYEQITIVIDGKGYKDSIMLYTTQKPGAEA